MSRASSGWRAISPPAREDAGEIERQVKRMPLQESGDAVDLGNTTMTEQE
jgi:hypothetical protein